MPAIERRDGVNDSERYLQRLGERSFLSLWSYAGVFRDQGHPGGKGDGKEVADLLVVFGDDILIFSDKYCKYPASQDQVLDWQRWYRKAVRKSADQLWGAERMILRFPDRLYLDRACTQPFPISLPDPSRAKIHRIAVAHGAAVRCRAHFGGGSGSLMLDSSVVGDADLFTIGEIEPGTGFVHVLDDTTLDIVLGALDTISDFVAYLTRKEHLFTSGRHIYVAGEEDLLAYYLQITDEHGEHDFIAPDGIGRLDAYDGVVIPEGIWDDFCRNPQRKAQLAENEISYSWDRLIEKFTVHALGGTQYYTTKPGVEHSERIMRFLAREPRTRRRMLARSLHEVIWSASNPATGWAKNARIMPRTRRGDPYYVFLAVSWPAGRPEDEYREARRKLLEAHCLVAKLVYPEAEDIVGIATEPWSDPEAYRSEDSLYLDARLWDDDLQREAESWQRDLGLWTNVTEVRGIEHEYPPLPARDTSAVTPQPSRPKAKAHRKEPMTRSVRNRLCPCGSGKKVRQCHGA